MNLNISNKLRYTLYGTIISASLITLVAQASSVDGVFGDYFRKMVGTCTLWTDQVITWFDNNPNFFGEKVCTTLTSLLDTIGIKVSSGNVGIGTVTAPTTRLEVAGNIIANDPTAPNHVVTRSFLDADIIEICGKIGTWNPITRKCNVLVTYTWQIGWYGACSASCGPGTQTATVECKNNSGITVADSFCAGVKPTGSQSCNNGACPPPWPEWHSNIVFSQVPSTWWCASAGDVWNTMDGGLAWWWYTPSGCTYVFVLWRYYCDEYIPVHYTAYYCY